MKLTREAKSFFLKCKRVWFALKKPTNQEFQMTSKIAALGILVLGFFGFTIALFMKLFF